MSRVREPPWHWTPFSLEGGYHPSNYEGWTGTDPLRLREVLANSVNVGAVRVLADVGPAGVVEWAQALGIRSPMKPDLSLALGSYEVLPVELCGAYATFAAGGTYEEPRLVSRIVGPDGKDTALPPPLPASSTRPRRTSRRASSRASPCRGRPARKTSSIVSVSPSNGKSPERASIVTALMPGGLGNSLAGRCSCAVRMKSIHAGRAADGADAGRGERGGGGCGGCGGRGGSDSGLALRAIEDARGRGRG